MGKPQTVIGSCLISVHGLTSQVVCLESVNVVLSEAE